MTVEHLRPEELSALVDNELPAAHERVVHQHLEACPACALRALSAARLKTATAHAGKRFSASPAALARLSSQLQTQSVETTARVLPWRPLAWAALAAALVLAATLLGWHQFRESNALTAELLDQHLATLSSAASPQVLSSDRHTVKPWFQGKLPFSFNLPEPSALPGDTALQGADLVYVEGRPAALLLFHVRQHEVSIFVMQRAGGPGLSSARSTRAGFTLRSATTPDLNLIGVSNVSPGDLDALMAAVVRAQ